MLADALDELTARLGHYVTFQQEQFVSETALRKSIQAHFFKEARAPGGKLVLLNARG
jgi:hypothetical protein